MIFNKRYNFKVIAKRNIYIYCPLNIFMTEVAERRTVEVNDLVRMAFGRGFSGDYFESGAAGFADIKRGSRLNKIIAPVYFPIPFMFIKEAGRFTEQDGSALEVSKKYLPQADKYASMYERVNGKKVTVTLR